MPSCSLSLLKLTEESKFHYESNKFQIIYHSYLTSKFSRYDESIPSAKSFWRSLNYGDELAWAALWLYYVTDDNQYLQAWWRKKVIIIKTLLKMV